MPGLGASLFYLLRKTIKQAVSKVPIETIRNFQPFPFSQSTFDPCFSRGLLTRGQPLTSTTRRGGATACCQRAGGGDPPGDRAPGDLARQRVPTEKASPWEQEGVQRPAPLPLPHLPADL